MFLIIELSNFFEKIRISSFNVISILSGTGYVTDDAIFEALRNDTVYGLQSSDNQEIKLNF